MQMKCSVFKIFLLVIFWLILPILALLSKDNHLQKFCGSIKRIESQKQCWVTEPEEKEKPAERSESQGGSGDGVWPVGGGT